jgi:hypothetical protein
LEVRKLGTEQALRSKAARGNKKRRFDMVNNLLSPKIYRKKKVSRSH